MTLRILHVIDSLEPSAGSVSHLLADQLSHLPEYGIESSIVTLTRNGESQASIPPGTNRVTLDASSGAARIRTQLEERIRSAHLTHLHVLGTGLVDSAARAAARVGAPYVLSPHAKLAEISMQRFGIRRFVSRLHTKRQLRQAACVLAETQTEASRIQSHNLNSCVEVIRPGLNADRYEQTESAHSATSKLSIPSDQRCLLFLGRIHPLEGIVPLMRACEELSHQMEGWHLVLAGPVSPNWRRQMEAALRRRGEAGRVSFVESPDMECQRELLARADLLVQPSLNETIPVSALQAMASGVPVIVSTGCDLPEVEPHDAGRVVKPRRETIRAALDDLFALSDERRGEMGENGRALVREHFSARKHASRCADLYRSLVDRGR